MKPVLTENFTAGAPISPYRICKHGAADGAALQAAASTDAQFGVSDSLGATATGDRVDIFTMGVVEVEYGGAVTRGDNLTADADGKAVTAAPGAGVNARTIGQARVAGVAGDIGEVQLSPGQIQG
ncbi:MAG: DUF2190 family protein [Proteobacteria bacterium]|nr:DUF2190 family protein [Pseudomonadota bacterium]MBU1058458.1 DUF2190 family protein [Pseudomonadota bacterium]